jgi:hypothetical protein
MRENKIEVGFIEMMKLKKTIKIFFFKNMFFNLKEININQISKSILKKLFMMIIQNSFLIYLFYHNIQ